VIVGRRCTFMQTTTSFVGLLEAIARGSQVRRRELSLLAGDARQAFARDYYANLQVESTSRDDVEASSSAASALRALWNAVPERLFTSSNPDFEALAAMAAKRCGDGLDAKAIRDIATVFRRIRLHSEDSRQGRGSLWSRTPTLMQLLKAQNNRCSLCGFLFTEEIITDSEYESDIECKETRPALQNEIGVNVFQRGGRLWTEMARRPEIDHIIPLFLGGDGIDNLQVLCRSCNQGKAEDVLCPSLYLFSATNRPSEHRAVSMKKRYLLLARHAMQHGHLIPSGERRLFIEDPSFLPTLGNVRVVDVS
jgi:5-methylcytosine-specific restriction endonuclease McrA